MVAGGIAVVGTAVAALVTRQAAPAMVALLLLLVLSQFGTLTTIVANGVLQGRLGNGLLKRRTPLSDIARIDVGRNHWI